jgi:hypothetical protein
VVRQQAQSFVEGKKVTRTDLLNALRSADALLDEAETMIRFQFEKLRNRIQDEIVVLELRDGEEEDRDGYGRAGLVRTAPTHTKK